jgi:acyl carrier protein
MNKETFLNLIKDQFMEDNLDKITLDIEFRKLESWDSLTGMAIITTIEEEFKITFPLEEFQNLKTIKQLYEYVVKN